MGRIAGVTAEDTRRRLLDAAAATFERIGYDATRVTDIAEAAGLSNGALYGHFDSKSELLIEAVRAHGSDRLASLFAADPERSVVDLLIELGAGLVDPEPVRGGLVIEALVAARRDREVAGLMRKHVAEREAWLTDLFAAAQADGLVDPALSPEVLTRFCLMLALGARLLATCGLAPVDRADWVAFVGRIAAAIEAPTDETERKERHEGAGRS